jgi:hypothetical protein
MFPLLRHIGQSSRYQIPPRPIVLREHIDAVATGLQKLVAAAWRCVDTVWSQQFFCAQSPWRAPARLARAGGSPPRHSLGQDVATRAEKEIPRVTRT